MEQNPYDANYSPDTLLNTGGPVGCPAQPGQMGQPPYAGQPPAPGPQRDYFATPEGAAPTGPPAGGNAPPPAAENFYAQQPAPPAGPQQGGKRQAHGAGQLPGRPALRQPGQRPAAAPAPGVGAAPPPQPGMGRPAPAPAPYVVPAAPAAPQGWPACQGQQGYPGQPGGQNVQSGQAYPGQGAPQGGQACPPPQPAYQGQQPYAGQPSYPGQPAGYPAAPGAQPPPASSPPEATRPSDEYPAEDSYGYEDDYPAVEDRADGAWPPPEGGDDTGDWDYRDKNAGRSGGKRRRIRGLGAILAAVVLLAGLACGMLLAVWMGRQAGGGAAAPAASASTGAPDASAAEEEPPAGEEDELEGITPRGYEAIPLPEEMRAMWVSFLEWKTVDFTSEETARAGIGAMFDNCAAMGLNTVIVVVRPFGDAFYKSDIYPWSHLLGGSQGQDPGYDPLAVMTEAAHARGLRCEAWVNPYRVKDTRHGPESLSADNPAALDESLVRDVSGNLWYDPGLPAVRRLVVDGVKEIVLNYDVDGIHFDDYFYPETSEGDFDADTYAEYGGGAALADWRRENNNDMVRRVYNMVKAANPSVSFGISMQGNNENNFKQMYADVTVWMAGAGYMDYVMPQIYWGFGHVDAAGSTKAAFDKKLDEWAGYPRDASVELYAGLGAYRIGQLQPDGTRAEFGGNGAGDQSEWESGHALADQVVYLRGVNGLGGFALFRYDFLYQDGDAVSAAEVAALTEALG